MKRFALLLLFSWMYLNAYSQFGFGTVGGIDIYQRYTNPDKGIAYPSSGNAILNLIWGPKMWIGSEKFSVSLEGQVNLGITSMAIKDYKGLGAVSFPVLAKLNFRGLSGFYPGFASGISIGGGLQWSKTELIYLSKEYKDKGVERKFFRTFITQVDVGVGSFGSSAALYLKYGLDFDTKANVFHVGVLISINKTFIKKNKEYVKPGKR